MLGKCHFSQMWRNILVMDKVAIVNFVMDKVINNLFSYLASCENWGYYYIIES